MRMLVTGALGVVGSEFALGMLKAGQTVVCLDSGDDRRHAWNAMRLKKVGGSRFVLHPGRIERADWEFLQEQVGAADLVLHAAASTGIPYSGQAPLDDWRSNVDATLALLEALRKVERKPPFVALSSVKPYRTKHLSLAEGETRWNNVYGDLGLDEDVPLEPDEPYAASKMAQSGMVMAWARSYDLPATVLRCSNLYGSAPCHGPRHGWLTWFAISAATGRPLEIQGSGKQTRDMLHTIDVASAVMLAGENIERLAGEVFNIGGGVDNTISVMEAAYELEGLSGGRTEWAYAPGRRHEDMFVAADHGRFTDATGWEPQIGVLDGLKMVFEWACDNADELRVVYDDFAKDRA